MAAAIAAAPTTPPAIVPAPIPAFALPPASAPAAPAAFVCWETVPSFFCWSSAKAPEGRTKQATNIKATTNPKNLLHLFTCFHLLLCIIADGFLFIGSSLPLNITAVICLPIDKR
jgi:hypothetical protein